MMLKPMRRITSGVDKKTKESVIIANELVDVLIPNQKFPSFKLQNIFYTEEKNQSLATRHLDKPYEIQLPAGAMRFLKMRLPTIKEIEAELKAASLEIPEDWTKFNMHSTDSVDYAYILSGKVTYIAGENQIQLAEGDFLAQIGPEHTWMNTNDEPCYVLGIMVGIEASGHHKKMAFE